MKVFINFSILYALTRSNTSLVDEMTRFYSFGWPMMPGSPFDMVLSGGATETWSEDAGILSCSITCFVCFPFSSEKVITERKNFRLFWLKIKF